ncbi:MAG: isoprenylcysteine carboxylmethyltransferase family protein [Candidatus Omnitrophica bacterium]|nr:isoprenylcysteine carboxylmethyltransferase family protein [Candidatus Omnitrophota bacterium]
MLNEIQHRGVKLKPPVILFLLMFLAFVLHQWTWVGGILIFSNRPLGMFFLISGIILIISAVRLFRRAGTTIIPANLPSVFIEKGPYQFTRNPMYVSIGLITFGIAVMVGSFPFYGVWMTMLWVLNFIHIPFEEMMLEQQFGEAYRVYKKRVRRWL